MDEKVIGLLATAVGVAAPEAAELVKTDEGISELQGKLSAKLADIKKDADGRALRIVTQAFKSAGVEGEVFEAGRPFKDNVTAAVEALSSKAPEGDAKLTDEQILKLPIVKAKLNELTTATDRKVQEAVEAERQTLKADREAIQREKLVSKVSDKAAAVIAELNPVFSQNAERAATQRADLLNRIASGKFVEVNGELFPADAEGEVLKDALGNAVKLTDLVRKQTETLYDLPVSTERQGPGNQQQHVATGKASYSGPTTQADYEKQLNVTQPGSPERVKLMADWKGYKELHQPAA